MCSAGLVFKVMLEMSLCVTEMDLLRVTTVYTSIFFFPKYRLLVQVDLTVTKITIIAYLSHSFYDIFKGNKIELKALWIIKKHFCT